MTVSPCPHCAAHCVMAYGANPNKRDMPHEWRAECACGYCGPYDADKDAAVRRHNKIGQNCGACQ